MLAPHRVASLPPSFYYIPNFITAEEETAILEKIPPSRWHTLHHRRLQAHPSTLSATSTLLAAPLPPWLLNPVVKRLEEYGVFSETPHQAPNHVLVNEYRAGEGIMPHEDGGAYAEVVATVSLGAATVLDFDQDRDNISAPFSRILQEPRSLLITIGSAYTELLHGIASVETDTDLNEETVANWTLLGEPDRFADGKSERETRISLTYRDVLKVSKVGTKLLGLGRR
ncbi:hypothetical protein W97_08602 [Coniosporium apollinis CBS 100218]|uniref:Fe2OG dioxygenase domain-containing protein n=1 Tax=Coniosporium apollinis (strain CBS 100218) TaxID=1168221 RepID=R7Z592_CONA1|nr:uncharacterized protein W97_08602 [Coniosporium apollinis CBS 100218]EON69342.1 hypothetical protein W97_08602 [Coniosporium apollinis CBS 100218]